MPDSLMICGVQDRAYVDKLARLFLDLPFVPGHRDGKPIIAPFVMAFDIY